LTCHSERSEESLIISAPIAADKTEMFESLALCFALRCSASLNMTALFKRLVVILRTCLVAAFLAPVIALALPDDATLSRLLVGTWQSHRHQTVYRADGTWMLDPPDEGDNTRGKWRIEHGKLIEIWRFSDEFSDSTSTEEIIELNEYTFKSRIISQEGPGKPEGQVLPSEIFTVTRVTEKK
jgi:hypothetical protein